MIRPSLWFLLAFSLVLFAGRSRADVQAPMFPKWQAVTPANMLDPVPEIITASLPGSVSPKHQPKPHVVGCPVFEAGKVIGWSLSCVSSAERGGIRARL